jgi:hypothetical protein
MEHSDLNLKRSASNRSEVILVSKVFTNSPHSIWLFFGGFSEGDGRMFSEGQVAPFFLSNSPHSILVPSWISMGRVGITSPKILDHGEISMGRVGFTSPATLVDLGALMVWVGLHASEF